MKQGALKMLKKSDHNSRRDSTFFQVEEITDGVENEKINIEQQDGLDACHSKGGCRGGCSCYSEYDYNYSPEDEDDQTSIEKPVFKI